MTEDPKFKVTESTPDSKKNDLLMPGLKAQNPPVLDKGRVKDTNLTNQDGQPLENNSLVTGDTGTGMGLKVEDKSEVIDERLPVNTADGTAGGTTPVPSDDHERMEERDKIVIDQVSKNPVLVRTRIKEDKLKEYQELLEVAHKSLDDAQIGDLPVNHPYWGLAERARQFGKTYGLI